MPKSRVRLGDTGQEVWVEHPAGASPEEITRLAREPKKKPAAPKPPAHQPDVVGRAHRWLTAEPPAGARTGVSRRLFGETVGGFDLPGRVVRATGDLFIPSSVPSAAATAATLPIGGTWLTAPLKRIPAAAAAGGAAAFAQGRDWASSLIEGAKMGGGQALGEVLPGALGFATTQRAAKQPFAAYDRAVAEHPDLVRRRRSEDAAKIREARATFQDDARKRRVEFDRLEAAQQAGYDRQLGEVRQRRTNEAARLREARATFQEQARGRKSAFERSEAEQAAQHERATGEHKAATAAREQAYQTSLQEYADQGATAIADAFKQQVPAWQGFSSDTRGLLGMVYGDGPKRASAAYDVALREVIEAGRGKPILIPVEDANFYGLKILKRVEDPVSRDRMMAEVDAGRLAEKMTGTWEKNRQAYGRAARALDAADIGDPKSRGEYKASQALVQFTDASRMLKGQTFNPAAAREGFTRLKVVDQLRKRGQGDIFQGPIAEAVNRPQPQAPAPLTPPARPAPMERPPEPVFRRPAPSPGLEPPAKPAPLERPAEPAFRRPLRAQDVTGTPKTPRESIEGLGLHYEGESPGLRQGDPPMHWFTDPSTGSTGVIRNPQEWAELGQRYGLERATPKPALPEGVKTVTMPKIRFWEGAALAELPFLVAGLVSGQHPSYMAYGPAATIGGLTGHALSERRMATSVPRTPMGAFAQDVMTSGTARLLGQEARGPAEPQPISQAPSPEILDKTRALEAEMRAKGLPVAP